MSLRLWLGTVLREKLWWWGWSFSKKHKSRSALAFDLTGRQNYAARPESSLSPVVACAVWGWVMGCGVAGEEGGCCFLGEVLVLSQVLNRRQHRGHGHRWMLLPPGALCLADTPGEATHPLVCFPFHGGGNTASIHFPFPKVPFVSAFQTALEQDLLLSICHISPKHVPCH